MLRRLLHIPFIFSGILFIFLPLVVVFSQRLQTTQQYAAGGNALYVATIGNDNNPCTQTSPCGIDIVPTIAKAMRT